MTKADKARIASFLQQANSNALTAKNVAMLADQANVAIELGAALQYLNSASTLLTEIVTTD